MVSSWSAARADPAKGGWDVSWEVEPVGLPLDAPYELPTLELSCHLEGEDLDEAQVWSKCQAQWEPAWGTEGAELLALLKHEAWTPCAPLPKRGGWLEAKVEGKTVAVVVGDAKDVPAGAVRFEPRDVAALVEGWGAASAPYVFARFRVEEPVEGGVGGYWAVLTPEELGVPRCVPAGQAPAALATPHGDRADPDVDTGCLAIALDGTHALFKLTRSEWDGNTNKGQEDSELVWVGPEPDKQPPLPAKGKARRTFLQALAGCVPMDWGGADGATFMEAQGRLWVQLPGHEPRWAYTLRHTPHDGGDHESIQGALRGGPAAHLFFEVINEDTGLREASAFWRGPQHLGLAACPAN
jgi:hypothetical protein